MARTTISEWTGGMSAKFWRQRAVTTLISRTFASGRRQMAVWEACIDPSTSLCSCSRSAPARTSIMLNSTGTVATEPTSGNTPAPTRSVGRVTQTLLPICTRCRRHPRSLAPERYRFRRLRRLRHDACRGPQDRAARFRNRTRPTLLRPDLETPHQCREARAGPRRDRPDSNPSR